MHDQSYYDKSTAEKETELLRQVEELQGLLRDASAVCACGCSESEHEQYDSDGESCGNDNHECFRTSEVARRQIASLQAERDGLERHNKRLEAVLTELNSAAEAYRRANYISPGTEIEEAVAIEMRLIRGRNAAREALSSSNTEGFLRRTERSRIGDVL